MSEAPLPDDLARWPHDPYALLGISRRASPAEVRRAYTRLIRFYKPEHFPEQFRRIRVAYEAVLGHAERAAPPRTEAGDDVGCPAPDEPVLPLHREAAPEEALDQLWQRASAGEEVAAYQGLRRLAAQYPGHTAIRLRLYWLLLAAPELDVPRSRFDWLVEGLLYTGCTGPLRELYREEVADIPNEAWSDRYDRLLACDLAPDRLAELAEWRWRAGVRLECWPELTADIAALRPRLLPTEETAWVRLLFVLVEELAWSLDDNAAALLGECLREVEQHAHLAHRHGFDFSRLDFLRSVRQGWQALQSRRVPGVLLRFIPLSWTRPFAEYRARLEGLLERISNSPQEWLDHFNTVQNHGKSVLAHLGQVLDQFEATQRQPAEDAAGAEVRRELTLRWLDRVLPAALSYLTLRPKLLDFCLREAMTPESVADLATARRGAGSRAERALAQRLRTDWPLRYVYRACRLFRG
jgi:hypothetical protein